MASKSEPKKLCFVIGPIGDSGTEVRRHADWLLKGIIKPIFNAHFQDFKVERADEIVAPGSINAQVITRLMDAELVIADMSLHNSNAFYELAIRHMMRLPTIHMIHRDWKIPFDVAPYRAIVFSRDEYVDVETAQQDLKSTVDEVIKPGFQVENPVTHARGVVELQKHAAPQVRVLADEFAALRARMDAVENLTAATASLTNMALNSPPTELALNFRTPLGRRYKHADSRILKVDAVLEPGANPNAAHQILDALNQFGLVYTWSEFGPDELRFEIQMSRDKNLGPHMKRITDAIGKITGVKSISIQ